MIKLLSKKLLMSSMKIICKKDEKKFCCKKRYLGKRMIKKRLLSKLEKL